MGKRGHKTPKHHNAYAENLVAEIFAVISDSLPLESATDKAFIKAQEKVKEILVRETHDIN